MKIKNVFFAENVGAAILLHMVVFAAAITSFAIATPEKIIAPERVKILDIDLSQVKISKDKTDRRAGDIKTTAPTVGDQVVKTKDASLETAPVVRTMTVNREKAVLSNRVVNVSVIDALRIAMTRCWQINTMVAGLDTVRIAAHLTLRLGGFVSDVWYEDEGALMADDASAYALDTVKQAIASCQPFSMLPDSDFETWKSVKLNFYPSKGAVE